MLRVPSPFGIGSPFGQLRAFDPASLFAGGQQGLWLEVVQSGGFSPAALFAGGQQGLLFEPEG